MAAILILLVGVLAVCYPIWANRHAAQAKSSVITDYNAVVEEKSNEDLLEAIQSAQEYNDMLYTGEYSPLTPEENGYYNELNILANGVMGYIDIPKINVSLPIYHGIGDRELRSGCGHMPQSSLPVGGDNTHSVLSSHSGSTSKLFTDLELMDIGDTFYIHILDVTLAYEVESIDVVLPTEIEKIKIEAGRDLCTLLTCTPYGVNTHRLLVTGHRIDYTEPEEDTAAGSGAVPEPQPESMLPSTWHYLQGILIGLGVSVGALGIVLAVHFIRRKKEGRKENE